MSIDRKGSTTQEYTIADFYCPASPATGFR
jgi:hypothetical protein